MNGEVHKPNHNPLNLEINTGVKHRRKVSSLAPSDSKFDRSNISNDEYIELLLFENKEIQSSLKKKDQYIETLQELLKKHQISIPKRSDSSSTDSPSSAASKDSYTHPLDSLIPPSASTSSNFSISSSKDLSIPIRTPLDTAAFASSPVDADIPQRSARRRPTSHMKNDSIILQERKSSISSVSSEIPKSTSNLSNLSTSTSFSQTPNDANNTNPVQESNKESPKNFKELEDSTPKQSPAPPIKSDKIPNDSTKPNDSNNETTISSDLTETTPKTNVTQHKNTSTSSFSSYKSRIKLPPTLQHQQQQRESMNNKELSIDTKEASSLTPKSIPKSTTMASLKSPETIDNTPQQINNDQTSGSVPSTVTKNDSPITQVTSQFSGNGSDYAKMPGTPIGFGNSKFPTRSNDGNTQSSQDDYNNFITSPNQETGFLSPKNFTNEYDNSLLRTPNTNNFMSTDSLRPTPQTPGSSFNVIHNPKPDEEDVNLFIKPEEFNTISIKVVSTISIHPKKSDDPNVTFSINDRESRKEMWRIRKTYSQLSAFDNEIRPIVDCFGLPPLPDRSLFNSTAPSRIESRKESLQNYFNTIFTMPHIPHMVLYRMCRYLSLDFVNPLDDFRSGARKEGFLIRRYKGLGTTWKIRWCQVDGPTLEIYETPGGVLQEQIKLKGTQIGRQTDDSVAEEKGYRHAFLILETTRATKLSSYPKHFFCTESDADRDDWINALIEFNDSGDTSFGSNNEVSVDQYLETPSSKFDYQDELEQNSKPYSSFSNNSSTPGLGNNISSNNDIDPTATIQSQEEPKDKKVKKRSIFPFRYKASHPEEDGATPPATPSLGAMFGDTPSSQLQNTNNNTPMEEPSIQQYLDQMNLDEDITKSIFGREISEAYKLSNHEILGKSIPSIVFRCLDFLMKTGGVYEEGIFRLSGSASTIRQFKDLFNKEFDLDIFESNLKPDMHTIAGLLKTYLRELPSPILGLETYNHLQKLVMNTKSKEVLAKQFCEYMNNSSNMDSIHYDICYVMFKFLRQIIANSSSNRMNLRNVCIVFVPTLNISLDILVTLIVDFDCIFEGGQPVLDENREVVDLQIPNF